MAFSYRNFFFGGKTFCCCLPVRMGVIVMSLLSILFAGTLSIILWFEVASTVDMSSGEKAAFVVAGLVETLLFVASVLGFTGAIVRKQLFVMIYAYFVYIHFLLNIGIATWLLWMITHATNNLAVEACQDTIHNAGAQSQCSGLLKITQSVYFVVAALVLLIELYGAIIVARYVNQLKSEKRNVRASRMMGSESGFNLIPKGASYTTVPGGQSPGAQSHLSYPSQMREFDPYEEVGASGPRYNPAAGPSYSYGMPPPISDAEIGYGGGAWTHEEITAQEKERLRERDIRMGIIPVEQAADTNANAEERWRDSKSIHGPPQLPPPKETDDLPRYDLSDPPVTPVDSGK